MASPLPHVLEHWFNAVTRRPAVVVTAAVLLAAALAYYTATNIGLNADTEDMLSEDLPFRQNSIAISDAFPQFSDNIVVVVDGADPDAVERAGDALAERLRAEPALFGDVFDPAGDPFFRRNGLLYLALKDLEPLTDRLAEAQPFIGPLHHDPSLVGLTEVLGLAVAEWQEGDTPAPAEAVRVLAAIDDALRAELAGEPGTVSWRRLILGEEIRLAKNRRILVIQPKVDFGSLQPGAAAMDRIREIGAGLGLSGSMSDDMAGDDGLRLRLTGSVALSQEELSSVAEGMGLAAAVSLTLVLIFLIWGLRSWQLILATVATLLFGLITTAAFAAWAVGELNIISVAFAVLFIGLSVDFGIHFALRYREESALNATAPAALAAAGRGVGGGLALAAVAAAIGFFSFLPTDYRGLAELGLIAGAGMFVALIANTTLLPAILALLPPVPGVTYRGDGGLPAPIIAHARPIAILGLVLGLGAAALASRVSFDFDPLNLKDPSTESVRALNELIDDPDTSSYTIEVLADDLDAAREIAAKAQKLDTVDDARTLADLVPADQDAKLDMIQSLGFLLGPSLSRPRAAPPEDTARESALAGLAADLGRVTPDAAGESAAQVTTSLGEAVVRFLEADPDAARLRSLEDRLVGSLPDMLSRLAGLLDPVPVGLDDLPASLRERQIAADGRARVEIYPKHDPRQRANLKAFVAEVRGVAPGATGSPVVILEAGNTVIRALFEAAALSAALIALLIGAVLRSLRGMLLVFTPLVLAAALTLAASVAIGLPLNFANVIVLPLLFGLGVASGIHLVMRERAAQDGDDVMATSTPRAVVFSALTTIGSFGSIAFSSHPGTASMGVLLTIAIIMIVVAVLVVLPALMTLWPRVPRADAEWETRHG